MGVQRFIARGLVDLKQKKANTVVCFSGKGRAPFKEDQLKEVKEDKGKCVEDSPKNSL